MRDDLLKILLTNDDGIHAPGLLAAAKVLSKIGELYIVAPNQEQSGVGSSLTLHDSILATPMDVQELIGIDNNLKYPVTAISVHGTPADSCILALETFVESIDLVISGINRGSNIGADIMVSGTVGAALQGFLRGIPTVAISVASVQNPQFEVAARLLQIISQIICATNVPESIFLNVNVPSMGLEAINGIQITTLGGRSYGESVKEEKLGDAKKYRISRNRPITGNNPEGTDIWAIKNNKISITPLHVNLTKYDHLSLLENLFSNAFQDLKLQLDQ